MFGERNDGPRAIERFGLLHSDGSLSILPGDADVDVARKEAEVFDLSEAEPETRIVRVAIQIVQIYEKDKDKGPLSRVSIH